MTIDVQANESATAFVNGLCFLDGVSNAALVSYNGKYMS